MFKRARSLGTIGVVMALALSGLTLLPSVAGAAPGDPVVTLEDGVNGCMGVRTTPGSQNTDKQLDPTFASDFNPGGTVGYVITYPVDATDVTGRTTFVITDCVFVNDVPIAMYSVSFVPNTEEFKLRFSVPIPADTLLGAQFCNYAKTTAAPSASQASNRKAGPACFTVGGGLRIEKRSGSATGPVLPGASFTVVCTPTVSQPPTIITGLNPSVNTNGIVSASGVATAGTIAIVGPSGTPCVVTETAPPAGYQPDLTPRSLVIPVGSSQTINVFVNLQLGSLTITKAANAAGSFSFDIDCTGTAFDRENVSASPGTPYVLNGIPTGTVCTVTEDDHADFTQTLVVPANGQVTIDADGETVAFTNVRDTGSLTITKAANAAGSFSFDIDCTGTAFDRENVSASPGDDYVLNGIPTGTVCTVTEDDHADFTQTLVVPANGQVTIDANGETVAFTNVRDTGALTITKAANEPGSFSFDIDCTGTAFDRNNVSASPGTPYVLSGIPTGTSCAVTEDDHADFTQTLVVPANGTVIIDANGETVAFTNAAKPNGITVDKKVNGADHATIEDALLAHSLDTLTYTVVITNNGQVPLTITALSDSLYAGLVAACPQGVDSVLAPGASFTCTYQVSAGDDAHNVAVVSAVDSVGRSVSDSDETFVDLIHPAITIDKTANPTSVTDSGPVTYTYVVTNTGDTALTNVVVTDDIIGAIGVLASLAPGESKTLTRTVNVDTGTSPTNIGTATGTDILGKTVSDTDDATITVVLGLVEVLPLAELPRTGSPLGTEVRVALIMIQVGLALGILSRRRRRYGLQAG